MRGNERGSSLVETPMAICILLLLGMGVVTIVQVVWTHLDLASSVRTATRYASHVDYDPVDGGTDRRRTEAQVQAWMAEVADAAGVAQDDVTVVARDRFGNEVPLTNAVAGDTVVVTARVTVSNPVYRLAAAVTNAAGGVIGAGSVFDPDGVDVMAEAVTFVE